MPQAAAREREGFVADEPEKIVTPIKTVEAPQAAEPPPVLENDAAPEPEAEKDFFVTKWPMRIRLLHKKIRNNKNEEVDEISFREPTGADINRYGSPVKMNADGIFDIDDKKMAMVMAALSGINLPFLERMDPRDWNSCAYRLRLYFQPDTTGWL